MAPAAPVPAEETLRKASVDRIKQDARSLFYANSIPQPEQTARQEKVAQPDKAAHPQQGAGPQFGAASAGALSSASPAAPGMTSTGFAAMAKKETAAGSLGVRISILRGAGEAAVNTVLNAGESVRLRLTPNADGFLYVAIREDRTWRTLVSGPAERLKPFETPPLPFAGAGQRQLYVMLSLQPQTVTPQSLAGLARTNLVETTAEQDRATYVVTNQPNDSPAQIVQPITLRYR
jgi:hypothetical protein